MNEQVTDTLPVLQPITVEVVQRPTYVNTHLSDVKTWFVDNAKALDGFWCLLSRTYGRPDVDYFTWLACQHDIEVIRSKS